MENMNEMFNNSTENSVYVEGTEETKKKFIPINPGEYFGHIKADRLFECATSAHERFMAY